jgi:uncharacterized protein
MRNARGLWIFAGIMLLLDLYLFQVLKFVSASWQARSRLIFFALYWTLAGLSVMAILLLPVLYENPRYKTFISYAFSISIGFFIFKLLASFFFLIDDIRRMGQWMLSKTKLVASPAENGISRSSFLSWLGLTVGGSTFATLLYGFSNKYDYRVKKIPLRFEGLPAGFAGLKVVQLSDIHSGSFDNPAAVARGVELVMQQKPDLILFTGDLVNNLASEMTETYQTIFSKLQAPLGVYSILGNHDYGDYHPWPDRDEAHHEKEAAANRRLRSALQEENLENLKQIQKNIGWKLLMNEHVVLERNGDQMALIGIENWSAKGSFPKYGKMAEAWKGTENIPFKILMSHDPSHWDAEVRTRYPDVNLTLSGHTHGMQFGVEIPGLRWSPVQYVYKKWAGLYEEGYQKLYVNRGFGFIGYPGRVGILPEITVLEIS